MKRRVMTRRVLLLELTLCLLAVGGVVALVRSQHGSLPMRSAAAELMTVVAESNYLPHPFPGGPLFVAIDVVSQETLAVSHTQVNRSGWTMRTTTTVRLQDLDPAYLDLSPIELQRFGDRPCVVLAARPTAPEFPVTREYPHSSSAGERMKSEQFVCLPFATQEAAENAKRAILELVRSGGPVIPLRNPGLGKTWEEAAAKSALIVVSPHEQAKPR